MKQAGLFPLIVYIYLQIYLFFKLFLLIAPSLFDLENIRCWDTEYIDRVLWELKRVYYISDACAHT